MTPASAELLRPRGGVAEVADDVYRLELPIPFPAATANAYLIVDEPLVLIDVGANMPGAVEALEARLGALGYRLEDVGLVLLTHPHVDHSGLTGVLAEHTDADVAAIEPMVPFVEDYWELAKRDEEFSIAVMERYGVPPAQVEEVRATLREERQWSSVGCVDHPLPDGAVVALGSRTLNVHHRPGHSPVDTVFHDPAHGLLFVGDHLLEKMSPSPAVWAPLEGPPDLDRRPLPLVEYQDSLELTWAQEADLALPGHGEPIEDHRAVVDNRLGLQQRRLERLTEMLEEGPATAFELAHDTWGRFAAAYPFRSLCEIVVHMDLLVEAGTAHELGHGDVIEYERTA